MSDSSGLYQLLIVTVIVTFILTHPVICDDYLRSSYVKKLTSCSLADFSRQNVTVSEKRCKYACLNDKDNCVAYQWDEASGNCQMQDTLQISASTSAQHAVGVLMEEEDLPQTTCGGITCPEGHRCQDSGPCAGFEVTCVKFISDCAQILADDAASESGVYAIEAGGQLPKQVWCDMDTDGGGWTVFLKRVDGSVDFYRDYADYQEGFGDVSGEFWMGLDALHAMTSSKTYQVRAGRLGRCIGTLHSSLLVADESDGYRLTVGMFMEGEGGKALSDGDSMQFTTRDRDLDAHISVNCAWHHKGAFWYRKCQRCNPMGVYYTGGAYLGSRNNGIEWRSWRAHRENFYSMKTLALKLRP